MQTAGISYCNLHIYCSSYYITVINTNSILIIHTFIIIIIIIIIILNFSVNDNKLYFTRK